MLEITPLLGWIATAITVVGVLMPTRRGLHSLQLGANVLWAAYAVVNQDWPLTTVSCILIGAHVFRLKKEPKK